MFTRIDDQICQFSVKKDVAENWHVSLVCKRKLTECESCSFRCVDKGLLAKICGKLVPIPFSCVLTFSCITAERLTTNLDRYEPVFAPPLCRKRSSEADPYHVF